MMTPPQTGITNEYGWFCDNSDWVSFCLGSHHCIVLYRAIMNHFDQEGKFGAELNE